MTNHVPAQQLAGKWLGLLFTLALAPSAAPLDQPLPLRDSNSSCRLGALALAGFLPETSTQQQIGATEILNWPLGKRAAVSITYDGGTINQFGVALPIMNQLGLPATFFIVTGDISGSRHQGRFLGRPFADILRETATMPVNQDNLFERASALHFCAFEGANDYHTRAGDLFELGRFEDARKQVEGAYSKLRAGELKPMAAALKSRDVDISWAELRQIAAQGHEFASHSITHPQCALLDNRNLEFELQKSREEILAQLGPKHTFSHECPYGTRNPRVLGYALKTYPVLRNHMPDAFLEEINRWNKKDPGASTNAYVQWQRGPRTDTTVAQMKSWVDTCLAHDNIWLVLVFHGVDGIGYQPKTGSELRTIFEYLKSKEAELRASTFQDTVKYMRERMAAKARASQSGNRIKLSLTHTLNRKLYNVPLTLKTYVPKDWPSLVVRQGKTTRAVQKSSDDKGSFILYDALPNAGVIEISPR